MVEQQKRDDGGNAFPVHPDGNTTDRGMPLRDYFAAKFAAAWLPIVASRVHLDRVTIRDDDIAEEANRRGLHQADAMLAQRNK